MGVLQAVLTTQLDKKLTEASLLANYAKVVVALDEMVQQGHLENADEASIDQMIKPAVSVQVKRELRCNNAVTRAQIEVVVMTSRRFSLRFARPIS